MLSMKKSDTLSLLIISFTIGHNIFTILYVLSLESFQNIIFFFFNPIWISFLGIAAFILISGILILGFVVDKIKRLTPLIQLSFILIIIVLIFTIFLPLYPIQFQILLLFATFFVMFFNIISSISFEVNFISLGVKKREQVVGICLLALISGFAFASLIFLFVQQPFYLLYAIVIQILLEIIFAIIYRMKVNPIPPERLELSNKVFIYFISWISILIFCILGTDVPAFVSDFIYLQFNLIDLFMNAGLILLGILVSVLLGRKLSFTIPFILYAIQILLLSIYTTIIPTGMLGLILVILELVTIGSIFPNIFLVFSYLKAKHRAKYFTVFMCILGSVAGLSLLLQDLLFQNQVITLFVLFLGIIPINFLLQSGVLTKTETEETLSYLAEAKKVKKKLR